MKKILFVLAATILTANVSVAQWTRINAIPQQDIRALTLLGDTILALSETNLLYKSTDAGISWDSIVVSNNTIHMFSLKIIDDKIYIGTSGQGVFTSADYGNTWSNTGNGLFDVAAIEKNGNDIYAATLGNGVYVFNQTFNNWLPFNDSLPTYSVNVFTMTSTPNSLLIGAGANGTYYRYDFNFSKWNEEYYDGILHPGVKIDKMINNSDTIFAVNGNRIMRSVNDGLNWVFDTVGTHDGTYRIIFSGINKYYTMTNSIPLGTWIQERDKSFNAGSTWANNEDFLPGGLSYDILEYQNKLFLGRGDGIYVKSLASGIDYINNSEGALEIYPNPSAGGLLKVSSKTQVKKCTISNTCGQILYAANISKMDFTIRPDLSQGVYFVTFLLVNDQQVVKRIAIE